MELVRSLLRRRRIEDSIVCHSHSARATELAFVAALRLFWSLPSERCIRYAFVTSPTRTGVEEYVVVLNVTKKDVEVAVGCQQHENSQMKTLQRN